MPVNRTYLILTAFALAAGASLLAANFSVTDIEEKSEFAIRNTFDVNDMTWAEVQADGLQVMVAGTAPTEALRFQALSLAGSIVDAERLIDEMQVAAVADIAPPKFSAEVLRNTSGVSIIGLIPDSGNRGEIVQGFSDVGDLKVTDLLETADYPTPDGWDEAMRFAVHAIQDLQRAKVSVEAGRVVVTAIANSADHKKDIETRLRRAASPGLNVSLEITAPRPVISPFTLRFVRDETGARFDACSADTSDAAKRILAAASRAGNNGVVGCTIGMGVPSPNWATAVEMAVGALSEIGLGTVTFSDADVTLAAMPGADPVLFDRIIGELETSLPDVFVLTANLPVISGATTGPAEFIATLSPEGQVQLRGRIGSKSTRNVADSFARAKFGSDNVYTAARIVSDLPADWMTRVLTGLEALGFMNNGVVTVTPELISLSGRTGSSDANETIARIMVDKLGDGGAFDINVTYAEELDPVVALPTPAECEAQIAKIVADGKINFEPGSATIDSSALTTMDKIADILRDCGDLKLEVQGHTDSQGRESMNLSLSQARAESVLNELRARRVLTSGFIAKGYGEVQPIATNGNGEGREANRRIEFRLILPKPSLPEGDSALESMAKNGDTEPDGE